MQSRLGNDCESKYEIPSISMSCLSESDFESSLNPYALEFIPSYLKSGKSDNGNKVLWNSNEMKTEATSTTTLMQREIVHDATQRQNVQRKLFRIMHQMGEQLVPLKAINFSLTTDGQGVNVHFKMHQPLTVKQVLDESLCKDAALQLDMIDCAFIPRQLPNVLALKFLLCMGDTLNDKIKWNEQNEDTTSSTSSTEASLLETKSSMGSKLSMESKYSSENKLQTKKTTMSRSMQLPAQTISKNSLPIKRSSKVTASPSVANKSHSTTSGINGSRGFKAKPFAASEANKPSSKSTDSSEQSLGQIIKRGVTGKTFLPRSTHTSQMRHSQVLKRMSLLK